MGLPVRLSCSLLLFILLLLPQLVLAAPSEAVWQAMLERNVELVLDDGSQVAGKLAGVDGDVVVLIKASGQIISVAKKDVEELRAVVAAPPPRSAPPPSAAPAPAPAPRAAPTLSDKDRRALSRSSRAAGRSIGFTSLGSSFFGLGVAGALAATGIAIATNDEDPAQAISAVSLGVVGLGLGFSIVGSTSAHRSLRWAGGKRSKGLFVTGTVLYSVGLLLGVGATLFTLDEDGPGPAMAGGGLALAIAGFACLTADAGVTRRRASEQRDERKRRAAAPLPWLAPSSQGLAAGIAGSLP